LLRITFPDHLCPIHKWVKTDLPAELQTYCVGGIETIPHLKIWCLGVVPRGGKRRVETEGATFKKMNIKTI